MYLNTCDGRVGYSLVNKYFRHFLIILLGKNNSFIPGKFCYTKKPIFRRGFVGNIEFIRIKPFVTVIFC